MSQINVQLDFGTARKIHSLTHSFFNNSPGGVQYSVSEFKGINKMNYDLIGKTRKFLIKLFPFLKKMDSLVLLYLRKESKKLDLIHFVFHLGKTRKKAVVDYETAYTFVGINTPHNEKKKKEAIKTLKKGNIKYLLPIHKEALKSFNLFFGDKISIPHKIIYPTIFIPEEKRVPAKKKKKIIFISTSNIFDDKFFLIKGGLETLKAFVYLSKKYKNYEFIFLGKIPKPFQRKVPKNLKLIEEVSREEMWEMLNESQVFVQPCYQAPAMAFIEAMFFKIPIVTTNFWANQEYVDDKNGVIVDSINPKHLDKNNVPVYPPIILERIRRNSGKNAEEVAKAIEKLIKNSKLRKKLGENGFKRVTEGKFSIQEKNRKLLEVYKEALK